MVPYVTVPMNFGREMLNSPTHSNLCLNTSEGVVRASSVILSLNSPVISHITGTLHMTSVDMLEFSEEAVRLFVDAAYSGTSEGLTPQLFRDFNKICHVFKVSWLSHNCAKFFTKTTNSVSNYHNLCFLFDEAVFVMKNLKSRDYLEVVIKKVDKLNYKQQFLCQYLEGAERLSTYHLDAALLLAGDHVSCIVKTLTRQLSHQFRTQKPCLSHAHKYLLDNANLYLCKKSNSLLFNHMFDLMEQLPEDMTKWVLKLYRKSEKDIKPILSAEAIPRCDVIPNMYHEVDFGMTMCELENWLSQSKTISNVLMALEVVETWYLYNTSLPVIQDNELELEIGLILEIMHQRSWCRLPYSLRNLRLSVTGSDLFGCVANGCVANGPFINICCEDECTDPLNLLSKDAKLMFKFRHPSIEDCNLPGKCGFILKTMPKNTNGVLRKLELCVEKKEYHNKSVHFHEEVRAENMHVYFIQRFYPHFYLYPLSWLKFLHSKFEVDRSKLNLDVDAEQFISSCDSQTQMRDYYVMDECFHNGSKFCVLYKC